MASSIDSYAQALYAAVPDRNTIQDGIHLLRDNPILSETLSSAVVSFEEKENFIRLLFPDDLEEFIVTLCRDGTVSQLPEIFDAYLDLWRRKQRVVRAIVEYVTPLTPEQLDGMREKIRRETDAREVELETRHNPELLGGFVLQIGDKRYDYSRRRSFEELQKQLKERVRATRQPAGTKDVISVLKTEIQDFDQKFTVLETGTVTSLGDGIVNVFGMEHVMYGELVEFENGVRGIVQNVEARNIGVVLLGSDHGITEGTKVFRTQKRAGVGVGQKLLGRVINALGAPIDGGEPIETEDFYPIERIAPGVVHRKPVSVPLQTGILSIDAMFPIGRGQRELIIGDRQTGKTSIAVDTIIRQKGQNVICIYVAIGQKSSTVAQIVSTLQKYDAMSYSIVLSASASEPAPVQYIAPYSGTAIAEYFMTEGRDVLIVYDDLSKHAVAYRAMSLLLHRPPGREAYPGDVFYLHSRLLERSCRLDEERGGGSITALPIVETQAGDVSAYIPTNVISITDGQIFLESELFNAGQRPAVNVGLSVSRVGGAAQRPAVKGVAGQMRIELAQYREMEVFTQFSSDLDPATQEMLDHGKILMELLKQPLYHPLRVWQEVVLLVAASEKLLDDVAPTELNDFRAQLLQYIETNGKVLTDEVEATGKLSAENRKTLLDLIAKFKQQVY